MNKLHLANFGYNTKLIRTKFLDMSIDGMCNICGIAKSTYIALEKGYRSVEVVNYLKVREGLNKTILTLKKRNAGITLDLLFHDKLEFRDLVWIIEGVKEVSE